MRYIKRFFGFPLNGFPLWFAFGWLSLPFFDPVWSAHWVLRGYMSFILASFGYIILFARQLYTSDGGPCLDTGNSHEDDGKANDDPSKGLHGLSEFEILFRVRRRSSVQFNKKSRRVVKRIV